MLWNRNFTLLAVANGLLHAALYAVCLLLYRHLTGVWGCAPLTAGGLCALFAPGMFVPGAFGNYLVDRYTRTHVAAGAMLAAGALNLVYPYATSVVWVAVACVLQGTAFGVALMATGATLAIDVTPSNLRTPANRATAWSAIVGLLGGLTLALAVSGRFPFRLEMVAAAALCGVAALLVLLVQVCFRAPLGVPLCSTDRFLLPRTLVPGVNLMAVPMIWALAFVAVPDVFLYLCAAGGLLSCLLLRQAVPCFRSGRLPVVAGQVLSAAGLLSLLLGAGASVAACAGAACIGLGGGLSTGRFVQIMVRLPRHCERASGFHTWQLLWQSGFAAGLVAGTGGPVAPLVLAFLVAVGALMVYLLYVHDYYERQLQEENL